MERRTMLIAGGVLAVVLAVAVVVGVAGSGSDGDDAELVSFGEVTVDGNPLPILEDPAGDPAVGLEAPSVEGVDWEGEGVTIEPSGEPMVIVFLAHWCPHCQREVPEIQALIEAGLPEGMELRAVATGSDEGQGNFPPGEWLEGEEWAVPTVMDDRQRSVGLAYGLNAFPFWVVVDGDGRVAARFSGELGRDGIAQLFDQVAALG